MTLRLTLKEQPTVPLEAESISWDAVRGLSLDAVKLLPVYHGKRKLPLADFFDGLGNLVKGLREGLDVLQPCRSPGDQLLEGAARLRVELRSTAKQEALVHDLLEESVREPVAALSALRRRRTNE